MADLDPVLRVVALEGGIPEVAAQYNPKELGVDKSVPWQLAPTSKSETPSLTFAGSHGRTLSVRLTLGDAAGSASVQPALDRLMRMASIMSETGPEDQRRPPRVALRWPANRIAEFVGVIEQLAIRYETIRADGTPLVAQVELRVREAGRASVVKIAAARRGKTKRRPA